MGKKTFNDFFKFGDFFISHRSFDLSFDRTLVYCLLIYVRLTILHRKSFLLHPLITRLSKETTAFVSFRQPCIFLDTFKCSLLFFIAVVFTFVSLSIIRCHPLRPSIRSLLLLQPSPCHSVVYFTFLLQLSPS